MFYEGLTAPRVYGICSSFERFSHTAALRFASKLRVLREYIRGDADVIHDIAASFYLYEVIFPEPEVD